MRRRTNRTVQWCVTSKIAQMCSPSDSDQADWGSDSEADVQSPTAESPSSTNFQYVNYNEDAAAIPDYQSCPSEPSSGSSKPTKVVISPKMSVLMHWRTLPVPELPRQEVVKV